MCLIGRVSDLNVPVAFERFDVLIVSAVLFALDFFFGSIARVDGPWHSLLIAVRSTCSGIASYFINSANSDLSLAVILAVGGSVLMQWLQGRTQLGVKGSPHLTTNVTVSLGYDGGVLLVVLLAIFFPMVAFWATIALIAFALVIASRRLKRAGRVLQDRREAEQRRREACAATATW
jgi:hypothetical protein